MEGLAWPDWPWLLSTLDSLDFLLDPTSLAAVELNSGVSRVDISTTPEMVTRLEDFAPSCTSASSWLFL